MPTQPDSQNVRTMSHACFSSGWSRQWRWCQVFRLSNWASVMASE